MTDFIEFIAISEFMALFLFIRSRRPRRQGKEEPPCIILLMGERRDAKFLRW
jgi:hypothetical protein